MIKFYRSALMVLSSLFIISTSYSQDVGNLKLKDFRPVSIYKIPVTNVAKAKYPAIDMHSHSSYGRDDKGIAQWVNYMDACGIEKAVVFTGATGAKFDSIMKVFSKYGDRFELWCGFDNSGYDAPGYGPAAVKELERCFKAGAKGVGEIMYKGKGIPPSAVMRSIMLPDDPREDLLFEKCAELGLPVNLHISEDKWMYEKIDSTNDGLMNSATWQVKMENGAKTHEEMLSRLENTLKKHPKTTFIAAHLANTCADLSVLGGFLDKYPNLYADISARFGELAPIPKFVHDFIEKYQDRLVYGTDNGPSERMYRLTFRILETADEHFYANYMFSYHWPLYGLFLTDGTLKKLYRDNALKLMKKRDSFTASKVDAKVPEGAKNFLGRWDITVMTSGSGWVNRPRFCWLELKVENDSLKGRLQPGEGMTIDITDIKVENGELSFRPVNQPNSIWKGTIKADQLNGSATSPSFGKEPRVWTAIRGPKWSEKLPDRKSGKPVDLIGKDVSGWLLQDPDRPIGWFIKDGILQNLGQQANNIYSKQKFQDFRIEAEFNVDPKSNSGIYLRGRYEIQIMDSYGTTLNVHSQGALYGYIVPPVNACKPAGEWQTFEITIIANRVTVILNGIELFENSEVPGITGGALDSHESDPGPIMIQGDHGKVQFRKFIVTPLV